MQVKKRIVICCNGARSVYSRRNLIQRLIDNGCRVFIIAPVDDYAEKLMAMGCDFIALPMKSQSMNPFHDFMMFFRYLLLYRRIRPHLALLYTIKPNIYGSFAARVTRVPVINCISGLGSSFLSDSIVRLIVRKLYAIALKRTRRVFFQNKDDLRLFQRWNLVPAGRSRLVPGSGVDISYYTPHNGVREKREGFAFLFVGRLMWHKGLGEYVEAAEMLKARYPSAEFRLLGESGVDNPSAIPAATLKGWISHGLVRYLGDVADVRPIVAQADCVVLPSYREGVPRTLLEAAAMGKPLIAADSPGTHEPVDDGVNGYLCRVKDAGDLAAKMEKMMTLDEGKRRAMGVASRRKTVREFDEAVVNREYLTSITDVMESGRAPALFA